MTGVKQACPPSPDLCGLLAEGLHAFLQALAQTVGLAAAGDAVSTYLVSLAKTILMDMASPDLPEAQVTCSPMVGEARQPLQARWLGVALQVATGCLPKLAGLHSKALRAKALVATVWQISMWQEPVVDAASQACAVLAGHFACET